ncbi:hypothetical protein EDD85DRAFT_935701 [Armillaria nabsnona]|nr:hypothetical protein EDD85DRAFT_935701 [Armillaria nabsnona]
MYAAYLGRKRGSQEHVRNDASSVGGNPWVLLVDQMKSAIDKRRILGVNNCDIRLWDKEVVDYLFRSFPDTRNPQKLYMCGVASKNSWFRADRAWSGNRHVYLFILDVFDKLSIFNQRTIRSDADMLVYPQTPRTQDCTCGAPLADHVAIVNSYRLPAAISYAGGIQNICPPSSTIGPGNPSDNMNIILSPQPIAFSPSPNIYPSGTQQGTIQEEADVSSCHQGPSGIFKGDSDENGHFHDLNAMYGVTSVPGALAGFSA